MDKFYIPIDYYIVNGEKRRIEEEEEEDWTEVYRKKEIMKPEFNELTNINDDDYNRIVSSLIDFQDKLSELNVVSEKYLTMRKGLIQLIQSTKEQIKQKHTES